MGFFKRLFGIEVNPGEPVSLPDIASFNEAVNGEKPCLVYFFHLWCSSCQVMGGLLNEIGPEYLGRIDFYKVDIHKVPAAASEHKISGVPTQIIFSGGLPAARQTGLMPIDQLKEWIEGHL
ncbi:MAG: thiol reductase thioredoxin [Candidatus Krumholzibacteriota bacterium]|nr:thiol reductase thioredoxin [Candidatus Krumholzibacteriota bacterium]